MHKPTILVVDRDDQSTASLRDYLARFGFASEHARDARQMRERLALDDAHAIDLVVLDLMQPGGDGLAAAHWLRTQTRVAIVILSECAAPADRIVGLEMGADDYIAKPCEPRELVARLHSVLRRVADAAAPGDAADGVAFDGWLLHRHERRLTSPQGEAVALSNAEFQLLCAFLKTPRRVCSRDHLMSAARQRAMDGVARSIDLLVSRLRQKLANHGGRDAAEPLIKTVRGAGYLFNANSVREQALQRH